MSEVLSPVVASLRGVESAGGTIATEPFLATCRLILPVFDRLGVAFAPARSDVSGNIERLAKRAGDQPALFDIARAEMAAGTHESNSGCCKGLLWLKRFLEFTTALLADLEAAPRQRSVRDAANAAYERTLKPFHGWISSSAFAVVLRFPPARDAFVASLGEDEEATYRGMREVVEGFAPVLAKIHAFLEENGLNDPAKV